MAVHTLPTPATALVLVCGKCSRKLDEKPLAKRLAKALDLPRPRRARVRIAETRCLKYCPRGAVVVMHSDRPSEALLVPAGTSIEAVAAALHLPLPDDRAG